MNSASPVSQSSSPSSLTCSCVSPGSSSSSSSSLSPSCSLGYSAVSPNSSERKRGVLRASCSAVIPENDTRCLSAPHRSSTLSASALPSLHAQSSALRPVASTRSMLAPRRSSSSMASALPNSAAVCSGVHPPSGEHASTDTPRARSERSSARRGGALLASISAVEQPLQTTSAELAPASSSASTAPMACASVRPWPWPWPMAMLLGAHAAERGEWPWASSWSSSDASSPGAQHALSRLSSSRTHALPGSWRLPRCGTGVSNSAGAGEGSRVAPQCARFGRPAQWALPRARDSRGRAAAHTPTCSS
eukprot:scaffold36747_cov63-Phaeocystis_antarctica.AAC.5